LGRVWAGHYGAYTTNGNICTPVMMIAEKAADLILGDHAPGT
jgi:choline dehydrogenase-like flavoprotein